MAKQTVNDFCSSGLGDGTHEYYWGGRIVKCLSWGFHGNGIFRQAFAKADMICFAFHPYDEGLGVFIHIDFLQDKATSPYFIIHVVFDRNGKGDVLTEAEMIKV
ncbi:MAG: hypothetical protein UX94_C0011G0017 [Parcubacteria group bacterium GW2011_GWA2_47_21]|nr:MAG: hypothetical protein UX94_C0011G0017 [Parcubacteria group bacterium GW2011_GWA2_47_21]